MPKRKVRHSLDALALFQRLCKSVGSPYALAQYLSTSYMGMEGLLDPPDPAHYNDTMAFARDYGLGTYLKKYSGMPMPGLREKAVAQFKETESSLFILNRRIVMGAPLSGAEDVLSYAKRKIASVLGPFDYDEFESYCSWGSGATATLKAGVATVDKKILEPSISVTQRAAPYATAIIASDPMWVNARDDFSDSDTSVLRFTIVEDGRFTTVPKDWKSERAIDIQPTMNLFLQKGIGRMIRRRLKRCRIDLDNQSRNQILASKAFKLGYATIDLAKASDSISREVVRLLLPPEWFEVLDDLRTHSISIDGESHTLQKFSAMGNGFTFELESLIFYSICYGIVRARNNDQESEIAVYGDDIIVHSSHAEELIAALEAFGFKTNIDKTFVRGPFFESCGKHYFHGVDVTPLYQKEEIDDVPSLVRAHNRLFRWGLRLGLGTCVEGVVHDALVFLRNSARNFGYAGKRDSYLPWIPWYLEDDRGFLTTIWRFGRRDINGFARPWLLITRSVKTDACESALIALVLRNGYFGNRHRADCAWDDATSSSEPFYGKVVKRDNVRTSLYRSKLYVDITKVPPRFDPEAL